MKGNKNEGGITLIALIITVIILVILAVVSIATVYDSKIVEYAIRGSQDYVSQGINENQIMRGAEAIIDEAIANLEDTVNRANGPLNAPQVLAPNGRRRMVQPK